MIRDGSNAGVGRLGLAMTMVMAAATALAWPSTGRGQGPPPDQAKPDHQHTEASKPSGTNDPFADQVRQLRDQVAKIEAALSEGQGAGRSRPISQGRGIYMGAATVGKVPPGYRIAAQYTDCLRCHQTVPSGPLPPSHLEQAGDPDLKGRGPGGAKPGATPAKPSESPAEQLRQLRDQVARLESVLSRGQGARQSQAAGRGQGMGMGMMGGGMGMMGGGMGMMGGGMGAGGAAGMKQDMGMDMGEMGMGMKDDDDDMGMAGGAGAGMAEAKKGSDQGMGAGMADDMDMGMMGKGAMGRARGMSGMTMGSALPGFPGISHLYHIGADGFFLNHVEHITLTADQRKRLNQIKQKAALGGSSCARKVEEAEQELWELTASDSPDAAAIEAKVREIEKLRGDQRLAFIRAVGEAAKVLTDDQRQALAGTATEASSRPATARP